jgi:hypothetical protein
MGGLAMIVKQGDTGLAVGRVQQALSEAGYAIPPSENTAQLFDVGTLDAVRAFQASHLGPDSKPLVTDGVVGDKTWWALQHPGGADAFIADGWKFDASTVRDAVKPALVAAAAQISVHEDPDGSNDGPLVRQFTMPGFIGDPWCALFTSWAFTHLIGGSPFGRIASTWALYEWADAHGLILPAAAIPQAGDIFVVLHGVRTDPNHRGHTGMLCGGDLGGGNFPTIAGNESNAVRGGIRQRDAVSAILRVVPL